MINNLNTCIVFLLLLRLAFTSDAQNNMSLIKISDYVITDSAFNTSTNSVASQQSALVSFNGYQYATYWDINKHLCIARRELDNDKWDIITFNEYTSPHDLTDMHYYISMGICTKDGTIHLSFDQHVTGLRYYRSKVGAASNPVSTKWDRDLFPTYHTNYLISGQPMYEITYPRFISMPSGDLLFETRKDGGSGSSNQYLYNYSGDNHSWTEMGKYIDGVSVSETAYLYGVDYDGNGKIHITWLCRSTSDPVSCHDLYYIYSTDDGLTWQNTAGTKVGTTGSDPVVANSNSVKVWSIPENFGLLNQEGQAVDNQGRITIKVMHYKDGTTTLAPFIYYRDLAKVWHKGLIETSAGAGRSVIAYDNNQNCYAILKGSGIPRIYGATRPSGITDWKELNIGETTKIMGEGGVDKRRLKEDGILSLFFMQSPNKPVVLEYKIVNITGNETTQFNDFAISLSPNPSSGKVILTLPENMEFIIRVFNINGILILERNAVNNANLNLEPFGKGIYLIDISNDKLNKGFNFIIH